MDHGTETVGEAPTDAQHAQRGFGGRPWRSLLGAVSLLTVLPVGTAAEPRSGGGFLRGATALFPAVGAGIGGLGALVLLGADALGLGMAIAAIAGIGATVAVTGALHEDGLADFADGAGGGWTRGERLRIMRDSRIGSYGVLAVLFSVALRIAALASLASVIDAAFAMVAAAALSRAAMPAIMRYTPVARADGSAAAAGDVTRIDVVVAALVAAGVAVGCLGLAPAAPALAAGWVAAALVARLAVRALGGHTGDVLGAAQQAAETAALIALAALL